MNPRGGDRHVEIRQKMGTGLEKQSLQPDSKRNLIAMASTLRAMAPTLSSFVRFILPFLTASPLHLPSAPMFHHVPPSSPSCPL